MRRLIRYIEGERPPLIMEPRLFWVRYLDVHLRFLVYRMLGMRVRRPRYMTPRRTPEQQARTFLAIESYVGMRSPDPRVARYFDERRRWIQMTEPGASDEVKRILVAEGPRCAPEDEEHVLSIMDPEHNYMAKPEGQAAVAQIKRDAQEIVARLVPAPEWLRCPPRSVTGYSPQVSAGGLPLSGNLVGALRMPFAR